MYEFTTLDETVRERHMRGADGKQKKYKWRVRDRQRKRDCMCVCQ